MFIRGRLGGVWTAWTEVITVNNAVNSVVTLSGAQTINGSKTFSSMQVFYSSATTTQDDHQNSPISIRERGAAGAGTGADNQSPNLNFHWSGRLSNSLWMGADGVLNYGSYSATGVPEGPNGHIKTGSLTLSPSGSDALVLNKSTNGGGIGILFSDTVPGYTQRGSLRYHNVDVESYGSGNAFVFNSTS
jgi:hypothetical protein